MKKTVYVLFAVLVVACFINIPQAHAVGLGLYGAGGWGNVDWSPDDHDRFRKRAQHLGYGLALDTAPDSNKLFNYNLNIGYEKFSNKNGNAWGEADLEGVVMSHTFGFGGLITPNIRLWFGPELRASWSEGSPTTFPNYTMRVFGVGVGPALGVNFNVGERLTFVLKGGYQYLSYYGYGRGQFDHVTNTAISSHKYYYDAHEKLFYLAIEILARTSKEK